MVIFHSYMLNRYILIISSLQYLSGWWYTYPSEKSWSSSLGKDYSHILWKKINIMFEKYKSHLGWFFPIYGKIKFMSETNQLSLPTNIWDDDIPNWMESHKIPWFQITNQSCSHLFSTPSHLAAAIPKESMLRQGRRGRRGPAFCAAVSAIRGCLAEGAMGPGIGSVVGNWRK